MVSIWRKSRVFWLFVGIFLAAAPTAWADISGQALIQALRQGGHAVYFRHSATDWAQEDHVSKAGDWTSCDGAKMRQLSDAGRETARAVGAALRALAIPVGKVISSQYCRCVETARLLGQGEVEATTDIMNLRSAGFVGGSAAATARAQAVLATPPKAGTNTVVVGHGNLMSSATGKYTGEAGAVVVRAAPGAAPGFTVVAVVEPKVWIALAAEFGGR